MLIKVAPSEAKPADCTAPPPYQEWPDHVHPDDMTRCVEAHLDAPVDSLVAVACNNRLKSQLCRLPDPILVRLLQVADPVTRQCLRRTSRVFMAMFAQAVKAADTYRDGSHPWPVSRPALSDSQHSQLVWLLAKDGYCGDCLAARMAPDWASRVQATTKTYLSPLLGLPNRPPNLSLLARPAAARTVRPHLYRPPGFCTALRTPIRLLDRPGVRITTKR